MEYQTIGNHVSTAAPLISMMLKTVYSKFGRDFERDWKDWSNEEVRPATIKMICCKITNEYVKSGYDKDVQKALHISDSTYCKYIKRVNIVLNTNLAIKELFEDAKVEIMLNAVQHEKYFDFIKTSVRNELLIINQ